MPPAELPAVVRAVHTAAPVVPEQRRGSGNRPVAARPVHGRDMTRPYTAYDPLLPVVVDVDGERHHGHALGSADGSVHVGWSVPDGGRRLGWVPASAVTFA